MNLPQNWIMTTIGNVTSPRGVKLKPSQMEDAPFIGLQHVEAHTMRLIGIGRTRDVKSSGSYFRRGDVLYGRLRPYLNKIYMPDFDGLASGEFIVFPSQQFLDNSYLKYFLNQWEFVSFATRINAGDRPRVDFIQFSDYPIPLPPLPEQHRIVAEIEKQLTRLDASVSSLERVRANLKRYRASVLKTACEGKLLKSEADLAQSEGRQYESVDVLLGSILTRRQMMWESKHEGRRKYREPIVPDISQLPALAKGWAWASMAQIADIQGGFQKQPKRIPKENSFPYLRVANVQRGKLSLDEVYKTELFAGELEKLRLVRGDLLIVEGNGSQSQIGRMAIWNDEVADCVHQNHIIRARPHEGVIPAFAECYWNSPEGSARVHSIASSTSGLYTLSVSKVSQLPVPMPPIAEQHRIVAEVERRLSVIQQIEEAVDTSLKRAERLRQSVLKQAFCGRLVTQDPGDEPASALLERICAERAEAQAAAETNRKYGRRTRRSPRAIS